MRPARTPTSGDSSIVPRARPREAEIRTEDGRTFVATTLRGAAVLRHPLTAKGCAYSEAERDALGLRGLVPPRPSSLAEQVDRAIASVRAQESPIGRYQMLRAIQDRNEVLFHALLDAHLAELLPLVYTPTVGEAVERFDELDQQPRGIVITADDVGRIDAILDAWPHDDVRVAVATDASAILGIGDRGHGGIAISIGKLALYGAAGIAPWQMLPILLDVGTDREALREHRLYLGTRQARLRGEAYLEVVDALARGLARRFPRAVLQWEDLAKDAAFDVLARHRSTLPSFNDDIQGTGAVTLAGLLAACARKGEALRDQTVVVSGAGAGGAGVALAIQAGMRREGLSEAEARARVLVLDSRGLLLEGERMEDYKRPLAQERARIAGWSIANDRPDLEETVREARATVLVGLSGQPGTFGVEVVRQVGRNTPRPIVLALSNPISACEARPADVLAWTEGRAIVATGSPFPPVSLDGRTFVIGQGNNAFVFPGLGLGALLSEAAEITDAMVLEGAYALAEHVVTRHASDGLVYPPVGELREVAVKVAARVVARAAEDGVGRVPEGYAADPEGYVRDHQWAPRYLEVRAR